MFDFVWHLRGSIRLEGADPDEVVLDRVEDLLHGEGKNLSERSSDQVAFDDDVFREWFGPNWLAMRIYDRGRFWIERGPDGRWLRFDLRSLHAMVVCLGIAAAAFSLGLAGDGLYRGMKFAAWAFAWLYGMNFMLGLFRVLPRIRNAVCGG